MPKLRHCSFVGNERFVGTEDLLGACFTEIYIFFEIGIPRFLQGMQFFEKNIISVIPESSFVCKVKCVPKFTNKNPTHRRVYIITYLEDPAIYVDIDLQHHIYNIYIYNNQVYIKLP